MLDLLSLVAGLALMTYGADRFVLGGARLSLALRISPVIIGAVVIGFGTSAPELVVTVLATLRGTADIAYGNIVGSNTANILLVLGAAAALHPVASGGSRLRRELLLSVFAVLLLAAVAVDRQVASLEGVVLLVAAVGTLGYLVRTGLRDREAAKALADEVAEYEDEGDEPLGRPVLLALLGLVGTLVGAQILLNGAVGLARTIGISEAVIGLTIVAVGTSLPELVTAIAAARRGQTDLVVGNVLGSNVFNSLVVGGVAAALSNVRLDRAFPLSLAFMVGATLLAAVLLRPHARLGRPAGVLLLALFAVINLVTF